jgi:hypothetical protein
MINYTSKTDNLLRTEQFAGSLQKQTARSKSPAETEQLSASSQETLQSVLESQPEVRPEVVERGRSLAVDGNYPPKELIRKLSEMLIASNDLSE